MLANSNVRAQRLSLVNNLDFYSSLCEGFKLSQCIYSMKTKIRNIVILTSNASRYIYTPSIGKNKSQCSFLNMTSIGYPTCGMVDMFIDTAGDFLEILKDPEIAELRSSMPIAFYISKAVFYGLFEKYGRDYEPCIEYGDVVQLEIRLDSGRTSCPVLVISSEVV